MNKSTHRLIFNKSRGCMMAVAEIAGSSTKSPSGTSKARRRSSKCCKTTKTGQFRVSKVPLDQWMRAQAAPDIGACYTNAQAQYEQMFARGAANARVLGLTGSQAGVSLSAAQIASLTGDVIMLEE